MSVSAFAVASGNGAQDQTQTQNQTQDQTQTQDRTQDKTQTQNRTQTTLREADREQARLQTRDRLQISEEAKSQYQEREQEHAGACFQDTEQYWAEEQINQAYNWGLINGYSDGSFNPNGNISGMAGILMTSRLANCLNVADAEEETGSSVDWSTVPEWAKTQLQEKSALRIAEQSQCYGETQLNRLQFAVMLAKALDMEPADVSADTVVFQDQAEIPEEDLGYLDTLRTLGIIQGNDGCFCADQPVTRAQAAVMLTRMMEILA